MNQLDALRETISIAEAYGMPEAPGSDLGLASIRGLT